MLLRIVSYPAGRTWWQPPPTPARCCSASTPMNGRRLWRCPLRWAGPPPCLLPLPPLLMLAPKLQCDASGALQQQHTPGAVQLSTLLCSDWAPHGSSCLPCQVVTLEALMQQHTPGAFQCRPLTGFMAASVFPPPLPGGDPGGADAAEQGGG